ncbi:MAG: hypothetical protein FWE67_00305 [Planctomycetaceae bacterium]|nr:hypothetical protein [Planctomycetaceae bacterium]
MPAYQRFSEVDVDDLIRNAELRTELEPYFDEAISRIALRQRSLKQENEFLASMLDWETAPIEPIYSWFVPEMRLPSPNSLSDEKVETILYEVIEKLYEQKILLNFTDHLSDRELYAMICRDILPLREKHLKQRKNFIHWDCTQGDTEIWLRYYAADEEREQWAENYEEVLPEKELALHPRDLPQHPF